MKTEDSKPEILAPAGDRACFLAAIAAGADAVYLGLKHFSARMSAQNFSMAELSQLRRLANEKNVKIYIAMNVMAKPNDLESAGRLVDKLKKHVKPDALIIQDLGVAAVARQAGYLGEIHLSTLANVTHPAALALVHEKLGISRVILPRELSIDEIKACAKACPPKLSLEVFVHGALCYGVSGRCYWSSFLGGKSSLRGRCVQPCRRIYLQDQNKSRLFSCQDLSLDVLAKTLLQAPKVAGWKIEGRKKGPHYVYHVTKAYKILRDNSGSEEKKEALKLLERSLGRPGTHYSFLPQRPFVPISSEKPTASGLAIGKTTPDKKGFFLSCRENLMGGDVLRIGYEDEPWHQTILIRKRLAKGARLARSSSGPAPPASTSVFLIDRREPELMRLLKNLEKNLEKFARPQISGSRFSLSMPKPYKSRARTQTMHVNRRLSKGRMSGAGLWLEPDVLKSTPQKAAAQIWWWLPPVIWPDEEQRIARTIARARSKGARRFVVNAPWQIALFARAGKPNTIWAGPFINASNALFLEQLKKLGFSGAIVSPELAKEDFLSLPGQSPLPLGVVTEGLWPLCISRTLAKGVRHEQPIQSPKKEIMWVRKYGQNHWVFPGWPIDLSSEKKTLARAGYAFFIHLHEPWPRLVPSHRRTTNVNWNLKLL